MTDTAEQMKQKVLADLDEREGFMCRDGIWPSQILQELVQDGLADCEIRVGVPTYWRKEVDRK